MCPGWTQRTQADATNSAPDRPCCLRLRSPSGNPATHRSETRTGPVASGHAGDETTWPLRPLTRGEPENPGVTMNAVVREVLVVEDDAAARAVACEMLRALGYATQCTDTGAAAIEHCTSNSPDVLLMDVRMPDGDGLEVTRQLRGLQGHGLVRPCRVILTVPFTALDGRSACIDAGADGFVTKPLMLTRLGAEIVRVLGLDERDTEQTKGGRR